MSKLFGWLIANFTILAAAWYTLPIGFNMVVEWLAPYTNDYLRPTLVLVYAIFVDPIGYPLMAGVWAGALFIGGLIAGTKKGAVAVAFITFLTNLGLLAFSAYNLFKYLLAGGFSLTNIPPFPEGFSIAEVLASPVIGNVVDAFLTIGGTGGTSTGLQTLLVSIAIMLVVPLIIGIIAGIIGASIRPKED